MEEKSIAFRIHRFKPGIIDPPVFQTFTLPVSETMSVMDCLMQIQLTRDRSLMFRHSCHHSSCGTCAMIVNGSERLACITNVWSLNASEISLAPLNGFEPIGDLVVDMASFYRDIGAAWSYLQPTEVPSGGVDLGVTGFMRFENCIECGGCVSACPVPGGSDAYMGPAALAAIHREMIKSPRNRTALMELANGKRGQRQCQRALTCSRVCPTAVYPARHIADIRKALEDKHPTDKDTD